MTKYILSICVAIFPLFLLAEKSAPSPYGVCAHLTHWEYPDADASMKLMKEAGIGIFRAGFIWGKIERKKGEFNYAQMDNIVRLAEENGMEFSMNFPSGVPKYARPFPNHIDEMAAAAERFAARYKGRIKNWEVVNEPNHFSFWGGLEPNPKDYAELLKKVYPAIKRGDPNAFILHGGLAGVPFEFIEKTFAAGVANYFDAMNVHPYSWRTLPELTFFQKIEKLRAIMEKYGVGHKPIWITEIGHSSAFVNPSTPKYIIRALEKMNIDVKKSTIGYIGDEKYNIFSNAMRGDVKQFIPNAKKYKRIDFDKLEKLSPRECPALYLGENIWFTSAARLALKRYLTEGGVAVFTGGFPFLRDVSLDKDGNVKQKHLGRKAMNEFRLAVRTWSDKDLKWVKPSLKNIYAHKNILPKQESGKGFEDIKPEGFFEGKLFVSEAACGAEDQFIPFLWGVFDKEKLPVGALYKYGGDMKGGFIAIFADGGEIMSEEVQAKLLQREFLLARSAGVERVFKYCFRSNEKDFSRESHFGIVRKNLEPKPAYYAYKTLTEILGNSKPTFKAFDKFYSATWTKADGTPVCAVWTKMYKQRATLDFSGEIKEIKDYLGKPVNYSAEGGKLKMTIDGGVRFIIGAKSVEPQK